MSPNAGTGYLATSGARRLPARPIDMMHLAKQALGDPGLELEILRTFSEATSRHFAELEKADSAPDKLHHLNTLKGASIGVGAWSLAERAHIMQREIRAGAPIDAEMIEDLRVSVEELTAFIADRIGQAEAD